MKKTVSDCTLIECKGITVNFGHVTALDNVDFHVNHNELVGLIGDNGAGKSTLIKVISGIYDFYDGEIFHEGTHVEMTPGKAIGLGISTVHQHKTLCDLLDIRRNLFIGKEMVKKVGFLKFLDLKKMKNRSLEILGKIGLSSIESPETPVGNLSGGEQQAVIMARSMYLLENINLLLLDEPIRNLSIRESEKLLRLITECPKQGISVVFITHDVGQVYEVADRLVVLRHGEKIFDDAKKTATIEHIRGLVRGIE
jgi:simple sugar transport system ATP-binding protein